MNMAKLSQVSVLELNHITHQKNGFQFLQKTHKKIAYTDISSYTCSYINFDYPERWFTLNGNGNKIVNCNRKEKLEYNRVSDIVHEMTYMTLIIYARTNNSCLS